MKLKKLGHIACAIAVAGLAFSLPVLSGCDKDHPEAEITISFDGTDYVLEYKLYRNMYPQTVQHFIELAQNGFYDNTIIHNYQSSSSYWYAGGYDYISESADDDVPTYEEAYADGSSEVLLDYYEAASKEYEYSVLADPDNGKITPSVYEDISQGSYVDPLDTLIGEFSSNQHTIENGALKQSFGCLTFYYSSKSQDSVTNKRVYLNKTGSSFGVQGQYTYNSATSLFRINTGTTTSSLSSYCIFATLENSDVLTSLKEAVTDKSVSTKSVSLYIDNYDKYLGPNANEATYYMASTPIIIKSVKITKNYT